MEMSIPLLQLLLESEDEVLPLIHFMECQVRELFVVDEQLGYLHHGRSSVSFLPRP